MGCQTAAALWRGWDEAAWQCLVRDLTYAAHGGSGYGLTYADVLAMPARHAFRLVDLLEQRRQEEAEAIERAGRPR